MCSDLKKCQMSKISIDGGWEGGMLFLWKCNFIQCRHCFLFVLQTNVSDRAQYNDLQSLLCATLQVCYCLGEILLE